MLQSRMFGGWWPQNTNAHPHIHTCRYEAISWIPEIHTYTRTRTCMYAPKHTYRSNIRIHTHANSYRSALPQIYTHAHTHTHITNADTRPPHIYIYIYIYIIYIYIYTHIHTYIHTYIYTRTNAGTGPPHIHTYICINIYMYTHTHTHADTRAHHGSHDIFQSNDPQLRKDGAAGQDPGQVACRGAQSADLLAVCSRSGFAFGLLLRHVSECSLCMYVCMHVFHVRACFLYAYIHTCMLTE